MGIIVFNFMCTRISTKIYILLKKAIFLFLMLGINPVHVLQNTSELYI